MFNPKNEKRGTVLYIPHGGGPLPLLGDPDHERLVTFLQQVTAGIKRPEAILVISAHWEEQQPTVISRANPGLLYDYYGFPDEAYQIKYPVKGHSRLGDEVYDLLKQKGIAVGKNEDRGFDHGVFIPLKLMYPDASIPCVQLSLVAGLDPQTHIELGEALGELLSKNILIVGSGFSFHNMRAFFDSIPYGEDARNEAFQAWLKETLLNEEADEETRRTKLIQWQEAPDARYNHPREEHLLPLHVCYGIAQRQAELVFEGDVIRKKAIALKW